VKISRNSCRYPFINQKGNSFFPKKGFNLQTNSYRCFTKV